MYTIFLIKSLNPSETKRFLKAYKRPRKEIKYYYKLATVYNSVKGPIQRCIKKYGLTGKHRMVFLPLIRNVDACDVKITISALERTMERYAYENKILECERKALAELMSEDESTLKSYSE